MINIKYGNRGMTFEKLIEYANRRYKNDGTAIIEKQNTKFIPIRNKTGSVVSCKVEEKATVDYMGRFGDIPMAFEAKHCSDDRIDLKRVEPHQYEFLKDWTRKDGVIGFIIVSFMFTDFYLIPYFAWHLAYTAREATKRKVRIAKIDWDGFVPTGKASIHIDELPKKWRVETENANALDYLATVRRIWGGSE